MHNYIGLLSKFSSLLIFQCLLMISSLQAQPAALRIITKDSTTVQNLEMYTDQDTTLSAQIFLNDKNLWVDTAVHWFASAGILTDSNPPNLGKKWSFSPNKPGIGYITVSMDNVAIIPDTIPTVFKLSPPNRIDFTLLTPPEHIIAGDNLFAQVRIYNKDGLVPGIYCFPQNTVTYFDSTGIAGRKEQPISIVNGKEILLNQYPLALHTGNECFVGGYDTLQFVLFSAPQDSLNRLFANLNGLKNYTEKFRVLPGPPSFLRISKIADSTKSDTIYLTYPTGSASLAAISFDAFNNLRGNENSTWTQTGNLHPITAPIGSQILYSASAAVSAEAGWIIAKSTLVSNIADSIFISIGPKPRLYGAFTKDANGDGYIDEIDLNFNYAFLLPSTYKKNIKVEFDNKVLICDSISTNSASSAIAKLYLSQNAFSGMTRNTALKPSVTISDTQGILANSVVIAKDSAGPVISQIVLFRGSLGSGARDTLVFFFSEPILDIYGSPLSLSLQPTDIFKSMSPQQDSSFPVSDILSDAFFVLADSIKVAVAMQNNVQVDGSYSFWLRSDNPGISDCSGNTPTPNNHRVSVELSSGKAFFGNFWVQPDTVIPSELYATDETTLWLCSFQGTITRIQHHGGLLVTVEWLLPSDSTTKVTGKMTVTAENGHIVHQCSNEEDIIPTEWRTSWTTATTKVLGIYWSGFDDTGKKTYGGIYTVKLILKINGKEYEWQKKIFVENPSHSSSEYSPDAPNSGCGKCGTGTGLAFIPPLYFYGRRRICDLIKRKNSNTSM